MSGRLPRSQSQVKNADLAIVVKGRTFTICGKGQMRFLRDRARAGIVDAALDAGEKVTEELIEKRLDEWESNSKYATLDKVLSMMSPADRALWKQQYRFTAVTTQAKK